MESPDTPPWLKDLSACLGPGQVSESREILQEHARDRWHAAREPDGVVFAESSRDVECVLGFAHERRIPVTARGGGVGYVGGCVPVHGGISLNLTRMDAILDISAADGVAVVQPGVLTGVLQDAVKARGLFYPPDPASLRECTIGGNVATNAGGPRCLKYGVTRHYVLGLKVVLADGRLLECGSRCHKNKTGFDLVGLFVGSEGMLGITTEVTLRLIPHPPARAMLSCSFASFARAAEAVQAVLGSGFLPSALEIADQFTLQAARDHVGSHRIPEGNAHLLIEIDGQPASVQSECRQLEGVLQGLETLTLETATTEEACEGLWEIRRAFSYSLRATGLVKLNEDIVVPRGRLVDLAQFSETLQRDSGFSVASFGHAGDGNIHVNLMVPTIDDPAAQARVDQTLDRLFTQVLAWGGVVSGEHGIGLAKLPWFDKALTSTAIDVHRSLKKALDPLGILNPGKFVDVSR